MDLQKLTVESLRKSLIKGEFSCLDLVKAYRQEIENKKDLNIYLEVFEDALDKAQELDNCIKNGDIEGKTLLGVPFSIKDNIVIEGKSSGSASKILEGFISPYDATVIKKLKSAGAIFLGRTNMDEFALGGSTEKSAYGVTRNPFDKNRVSGGTSGGSAASVSSLTSLVSLGSDTGGSIRQPASFCGVVGLKPTYGLVSRSGLMADTSSFDCIGPISKTVSESEIIFNVIKGYDPLDSTTIKEDKIPEIENKNSLVVGVPTKLLEGNSGIDEEVRKNFQESVLRLKDLGFEVKEIELPSQSISLSAYYITNFAEVSSNLSRYDGVKYGVKVNGNNLQEDYLKTRGQKFGEEVRRRIILGTYVLSSGFYDSYYGKAVLARKFIRQEFNKLFEKVDIIMTPTSPVPAWEIGAHLDPLSDYLADIFTVTANLSGMPAISLPSGKTMSGLPIGMQFMSKHFAEKYLFDIGKKFLGEV